MVDWKQVFGSFETLRPDSEQWKHEVKNVCSSSLLRIVWQLRYSCFLLWTVLSHCIIPKTTLSSEVCVVFRPKTVKKAEWIWQIKPREERYTIWTLGQWIMLWGHALPQCDPVPLSAIHLLYACNHSESQTVYYCSSTSHLFIVQKIHLSEVCRGKWSKCLG